MDSNDITAGFDYLQNNAIFGATTDRLTNDTITGSGKGSIQNTGVYVQDEIRGPWGFKAVPGIRYDYHSLFKGVISPKFGVLWNWYKPLQSHGSVSRAFRAPATSELYLPDLTINEIFTLKSNPDLKPEYIWTVDGGVEYALLKNLSVQCDLFNNQMTNLISQTLYGGLSGKITLTNINHAYSRGVETQVEFRPWWWVALNGQYTYLQSRNEEYGVALDYVPQNQASLGVQFNGYVHGITFTTQITESYTGKRGFLDWQAPIVPRADGQQWTIPDISANIVIPRFKRSPTIGERTLRSGSI